MYFAVKLHLWSMLKVHCFLGIEAVVVTFLFLNANFPHRHNSDGTFDSICARCFITVATENNQADLVEWENAHLCLGFPTTTGPHWPS